MLPANRIARSCVVSRTRRRRCERKLVSVQSWFSVASACFRVSGDREACRRAGRLAIVDLGYFRLQVGGVKRASKVTANHVLLKCVLHFDRFVTICATEYKEGITISTTSKVRYQCLKYSFWLKTLWVSRLPTGTMNLFPEEVICQIMEFVEPLDIVHCTEVSLQL